MNSHMHTHTHAHTKTHKSSYLLVAVLRAKQGELSPRFTSLICGAKWHTIYLLLAVTEVLEKVSGPQLSPLWICILPMCGEPEANSLILRCWEAQWDGWLLKSSACSHKEVFDFQPYGDVWFLILNRKDLLWVNVSLSSREATDSVPPTQSSANATLGTLCEVRRRCPKGFSDMLFWGTVYVFATFLSFLLYYISDTSSRHRQ